MISMLWVVLFLALTGSHCGYGLPVRPTPQDYPHDQRNVFESWGTEGSLNAAIPALALVITAIALIFGCTWCYHHKDGKIFTASAQHLHTVQRIQPPDSGFSEPANNNISEDNNNGPISLREMQNIANNNAAAYIVSENEERNRISRESVVEFEPLPAAFIGVDPLEHCADWFDGDDFTRSNLQYLREIGRGWFGRVLVGEIEEAGSNTTVAVKILDQNATLEDKARFLDESKIYRDITHEHVLAFISKCLQEDPWILIFELCTMDLRQYLISNRPKMAILNESGVPLRLMCDVTSALSYLHSRGYIYGGLWSGTVMVRGESESARAVLGRYAAVDPEHEWSAPELGSRTALYTTNSEVWSLGTLIWEVCAWGSVSPGRPTSPPDLPCPYKSHLYQVMQLCWNADPSARPTAAQVHALINHLYVTHTQTRSHAPGSSHTDLFGNNTDFEERWQRLKPNTIPKIDEHVAIIHAPSTSMTSHFTSSDQEFDNNTLSADMDTAVSRSSSIMSDRDPLSVQMKSESLTNLHGSLEDVRNIYLTHNETAALECHQGNINLEDTREREQDRSDASMDPWLKDIIAGSQDDVSYYKDVSDVIKNLDNILNSEKTSSSESSHQASPSRDNLSLDCKKECPLQSTLVKSPGITNFQNILDTGFATKLEEGEPSADEEVDRDTIGTLSHSFERHSDSTSQHTLENLTPDTPMKDLDVFVDIESQIKNEEIVQPKIYNSKDELERHLKNTDDVSKINPTANAEVESQTIHLQTHEVQNEIKYTEENTVERLPEQSNFNIVENQSKSTDTEKEPTIERLTEGSNSAEVENTIEHIEKTRTELFEESGCIKVEHQLKFSNESGIETLKKYSDIAEVENETKHIGGINQKEKLINSGSAKVGNQIKQAAEASNLMKKSDIAEVKKQIEAIIDVATNVVVERDNCIKRNDEMPNEVVDSISPLKELYVTLKPSVNDCYNEQSYVRKDCQTPCDIVTDIRTYKEVDEISESIDDVTAVISGSKCLEEIGVTESFKNREQTHTNIQEIILPGSTDETIASNDGGDTLPSVTDDTLHVKLYDIGPESLESEYNYSKDETILISDIADTTTDTSKDGVLKTQDNGITVDLEVDLKLVPPEQTPVSVQNIMKEPADVIKIDEADSNTVKQDVDMTPTHLPPEIVQITAINIPVHEIESLVFKEVVDVKNENIDSKDSIANNTPRSDSLIIDIKEQSSNSTAYMDLINNTNSQIIRGSTLDDSIRHLQFNTALEYPSTINDSTLSKNDSTVYLDLPSFSIIKKTDDFLHMEKMISCKHATEKLVSSTPLTSDNSIDTNDNTAEKFVGDDTIVMPETKMDPDMPAAKVEKYIPESISPFESPSHRSHQTDTYDDNSSVVLGPFENSALDLVKAAKASIDPVELPRDELLAFSSNFSEINLETPSPLRDGNFLNEVPDIVPDDIQIDLTSSDERVVDPTEAPSDDTEGSGSGTQKHVSPSTPPNSPGVFLASTSQQKYLVDIDLNNESVNVPEPDASSLRSIDQIELQITSKLAMAENENNLNIEYSGPLTVEGLIQEGGGLPESDAMPDLYLAGTFGFIDDVRDELSLDEECVKALRNELELKLPLAQVAAIEPPCEGDGDWQGDLPPPPEQLVVTYSGALSPIQEETGHQLSAYENDNNWNVSVRTESSESYPEPCNNSTDSVTELPCRDNTYTVPTMDLTYTLHRTDAITMSADSLNASLQKYHREQDDVLSPVDETTYVKEERESTCEHLSQVSPFLVSPTTDTSETGDNGTRVSTLSRTAITIPTDAKLSKPSETQCLSKATSIDSWCSNDTLYNVEENFDDLAMDPDVPNAYELRDEGNSESTDTLTHDDENKEHESTYIIHDCPSEACETFSPDSITANNNLTYTKVKTDAPVTTPSGDTDFNDSAKNTQTKDLAYETLMSGLPSCSNCTTDLPSGLEGPWRLPQPELVRRSPVGCHLDDLSPPKHVEESECTEKLSPQLQCDSRIRKMDSIEISCLQDGLNDSPEYNYQNMMPSQTSTPLVSVAYTENTEAIPMNLPEITMESFEYIVNLPSYQKFQHSAECRSQDMSSSAAHTSQGTSDRGSVILDSESKVLCQNSNRDSSIALEHANYSGFVNSAAYKAQTTNSREKTSPSMESNASSEIFRQFANSTEKCSQYTSSLNNFVSVPPYSEKNSTVLAMSSARPQGEDSHSNNINILAMQSKDTLSPIITNYSNFENSAACKIQSSNSKEKSSETMESDASSEIFRQFADSIKKCPQDMSSLVYPTSTLLKNETKSNEMIITCSARPEDRTSNSNNINNATNYPDVENSVTCNIQNTNSRDKSSPSMESDASSEVFRQFAESIKTRPQDMSSLAYPTSVSVNCEGNSNELATSISIIPQGEHSHSNNIINVPMQHLDMSSPIVMNYSDFESSATLKFQNTNSNITEKSSQSIESDASSQEFRQFMSSVRSCPQDLSSLVDATLLLLNSERNSSVRLKTSHSNEKNIVSMQPLDMNPPIVTNLIESHEIVDTREPSNSFLINFDMEDETEQPHSIIVTEIPLNSTRESPNKTYELHTEGLQLDVNRTSDSHGAETNVLRERKLNIDHQENNDEICNEQPESLIIIAEKSPIIEDRTVEDEIQNIVPCDGSNNKSLTECIKDLRSSPTNFQTAETLPNTDVGDKEIQDSDGSEKFATVQFLNETFEELIESSVDESDRLIIDEQPDTQETTTELDENVSSPVPEKSLKTSRDILPCSAKNSQGDVKLNGVAESDEKLTAVTEDFLQNEQKYATLDTYFPLLTDLKFTGPASDMMSTSFRDSPTSPTSPECEQDSKPASGELREGMKDWDSDSDSHSSNSSSGEFIWKDGDGHETSVVPSTHFDHQRGSEGSEAASGGTERGGEQHGSTRAREGSPASMGSGDSASASGSGSEGDEVEFVPSSWDCRAEPSKSSLRTLDQITPNSKKRVVFKRQKYHCVYEYPREMPTPDFSPAYHPDLSTYAEWDPSSAEDAEMCYGQLFASAGADYDEDFFISSSARPFESVSIMPTSSQFFPGGMHAKRALLDRDLSDDVTDDFPPPPSPLLVPTINTNIKTLPTQTPSLDFTTPDSGVEDITPGSTVDEELRPKPSSPEPVWWASASSSESASPSSPGGELGGLRHTRDKLKLDLPPSPHVPSPRHNRVFNFVLDKPKRRDAPPTATPTPLVMTDDTPVLTALSLNDQDELPLPEPTFSTFGKSGQKLEPEQKIVLDEVEAPEVIDETPRVVEAVTGEGTVLDSGDEDSGIESSSKATLERKAPDES